MVWARMGMLDDAIREHLELKRLKGADPGDVARQEHEALGPVRREERSLEDEDQSPVQDDRGAERAAESATLLAESTAAAHPAGQETVEINMEAELAGGVKQPDPQGRAAPVGHPAHTQTDSDDSLEWEMPGDRAAHDESTEDAESDDGQVEDVLEETPDFLRETPEHERLWFEQRPPRDFDFNE